MKRFEMTELFKKAFPQVNQNSMSGMILFQGFCTGLMTGETRNVSEEKSLKQTIRAKEAVIDTLTSHLANLNQYLKAQETSQENPIENSEGELHV